MSTDTVVKPIIRMNHIESGQEPIRFVKRRMARLEIVSRTVAKEKGNEKS